MFQNNVSETGFYLRLQIKPTHLGPIDRSSPHLRTPVPAPRWVIPEDGDRISQRNVVLKCKQDDG
jgi:hypothetical protein